MNMQIKCQDCHQIFPDGNNIEGKEGLKRWANKHGAETCSECGGFPMAWIRPVIKNIEVKLQFKVQP